MAAWKLSDEAWDEVDQFRFSTSDAREFRNALIILKSAAGDSKAIIANELGCSEGTVHNLRKRFREKGVAGLRRESPPGRTSRADEAFRATLEEVLLTPPQDLGYGFSVWSAERLGAHLQQTTGTQFSICQLRRIMKQEGFTFQRPKHTMKGKRDEAAYEQSRQELLVLKKSRSARTPAKS
jgi:transposase